MTAREVWERVAIGVARDLRAAVYAGAVSSPTVGAWSNQEIATDAGELADLMVTEHRKRFPPGGIPLVPSAPYPSPLEPRTENPQKMPPVLTRRERPSSA